MVIKSVAVNRITAEDAQRIGADFVADNLGDQISAGPPWKVTSSFHAAWVVPLLFTSPGYGVVGIVGALIVDEELGAISAWTDKAEVEANVIRLTRNKVDELESAFQRAMAGRRA